MSANRDGGGGGGGGGDGAGISPLPELEKRANHYTTRVLLTLLIASRTRCARAGLEANMGCEDIIYTRQDKQKLHSQSNALKNCIPNTLATPQGVLPDVAAEIANFEEKKKKKKKSC